MAIDVRFIGKSYPPYSYEVGKEKVQEYAKAIKNLSPWYHDSEFAKAGPYGSIIAPPTFAVVYGAYLIAPVFSDVELGLNMTMIVHGEQELEFYEVVRPGDVLEVRGQIVQIENKEKLDRISIRVDATNQRGAAVSRGVYTFVVRK